MIFMMFSCGLNGDYLRLAGTQTGTASTG